MYTDPALTNEFPTTSTCGTEKTGKITISAFTGFSVSNNKKVCPFTKGYDEKPKQCKFHPRARHRKGRTVQ